MSGAYIGDIARELGIPDASIEDIKDAAERQMHDAGYEVYADRQATGFRVTVRKRNVGGKAHEPRFTYNEVTTSTSSYPVLRAWEKWREHRQRAGHGEPAQEGGAA